MLGPQHELAGFIIGSCIFILCWLFGHPFIGLFCVFVAVWGANLPDLIDPPFSPWHRSIGHSFVSLFLFFIIGVVSLALAILFIAVWWQLSAIFFFVFAFSAGFVSHLILDLTTPMGLPLFFGKSLMGIIIIPGYLVPVVNILLFIATILFSLVSIGYISKKIGGKLAMLILFIPVWGLFLVFGIALLFNNWPIFGIFFIWCSIFSVGVFVIIGHLIDVSIRFGGNWLNNRQMYKALKNAYSKVSKRKIKSRRAPLLAAFLSLLLPGMGQIYNGETFKGLKYLLVTFLLAISVIGIYILMVTPSSGISLICCLPIFIVPLIFDFILVIDAFLTARKINSENGW